MLWVFIWILLINICFFFYFTFFIIFYFRCVFLISCLEFFNASWQFVSYGEIQNIYVYCQNQHIWSCFSYLKFLFSVICNFISIFCLILSYCAFFVLGVIFLNNFCFICIFVLILAKNLEVLYLAFSSLSGYHDF